MRKGILYINQFFGQIGGEDKADFEPVIKEGLVGPAMLLDQLIEDFTVTHTIICGDNFIGSNEDEALGRIEKFLEDKEFDVFFAGPAFRAGRYGNACGLVSKMVKEKFNVPVITSMNDENPGVKMFSKEMVIFEGGKSAAAMSKDLKKMAAYGAKILNKEELLTATEEGYFVRGKRHQMWPADATPAADRVISMLLKKLNGEEFVSELPIPMPDLVPIAPAIKDLTKAKIAIVNTGGIVPHANPDRIQSASATKWGRYDISKDATLSPEVYKTIHAGFDPAAANADPNIIVPLDALRQYEKEGVIGSVHPYIYTTVGTGTTQAEAAKMANEINVMLKEDGVDGVIMVST